MGQHKQTFLKVFFCVFMLLSGILISFGNAFSEERLLDTLPEGIVVPLAVFLNPEKNKAVALIKNENDEYFLHASGTLEKLEGLLPAVVFVSFPKELTKEFSYAYLLEKGGGKVCVFSRGCELYDEVHDLAENYLFATIGKHTFYFFQGKKFGPYEEPGHVAYKGNLVLTGTYQGKATLIVNGEATTVTGKEIVLRRISRDGKVWMAEVLQDNNERYVYVNDKKFGAFPEVISKSFYLTPNGSHFVFGAKKGEKCFMIRDGVEENLCPTNEHGIFLSEDGQFFAAVIHPKYPESLGVAVVINGQVGQEFGSIAGFSPSPDGKKLVYYGDRGGLGEGYFFDSHTMLFRIDSKALKLKKESCCFFTFQHDIQPFFTETGKVVWRGEIAETQAEYLFYEGSVFGPLSSVFPPDIQGSHWVALVSGGGKSFFIVDGKKGRVFPEKAEYFGMRGFLEDGSFAYVLELSEGRVLYINDKPVQNLTDMGGKDVCFSGNAFYMPVKEENEGVEKSYLYSIRSESDITKEQTLGSNWNGLFSDPSDPCLFYAYDYRGDYPKVSIVGPGGFKTKEYNFFAGILTQGKPSLSTEQNELSFVGVRDGKIYFVTEKLK